VSIINDFLALVYPSTCAACEAALFRHERFICNYCKVSLPKSNYHASDSHEMSMLFAGRAPFVRACSLFTYEKRGRVQRLLHRIKYHGEKELAEFLGGLYAQDLLASPVFESITDIVPIPLHRKKLLARGFNQSEWFAKGLSAGIGRPVNTTNLTRIAETSTQTRKKKYERWENVEGIFTLNEPGEFTSRHVLLVDDVVTTGATIEAAWLAFKNVPDVKISVASIAFASRSV
jgi:ComF family protein